LIARTADRQVLQQRVEQQQQVLTAVVTTYRDTLRTIYTEYPGSVRNAQSAVLRDSLTQQGKTQQATTVQQVAADLETIQREGDLPVKMVEQRLRAASCATEDGRLGWPDACMATRP